MSDLLFKDKKKKSYSKKITGKIKTTIDNRHNQKLSEISDQEKSVKDKTKTLGILETELQEFNNKLMEDLNDNELNTKLDLIEKIKVLRKEISVIDSNEIKNSYILNTSHLLYEYFDENRVFSQSDNALSTNSKKKTVLDFFGSSKKVKNVTKDTETTDVSKYSSKNEIMDQYLQLTDKSYIKKIPDIPNDELDNCIQCNLSLIHI